MGKFQTPDGKLLSEKEGIAKVIVFWQLWCRGPPGLPEEITVYVVLTGLERKNEQVSREARTGRSLSFTAFVGTMSIERPCQVVRRREVYSFRIVFFKMGNQRGRHLSSSSYLYPYTRYITPLSGQRPCS